LKFTGIFYLISTTGSKPEIPPEMLNTVVQHRRVLFVVGHIEGRKAWKAVTAITSWKKISLR
jgi:hypothetical protein